MGIGFPWVNDYTEHQQKEQSSLIFICQSPATHQTLFGY